MSYQAEQDRIRRQRMLAQMLQQSGTSPMQQTYGGGMPVPTTGLQSLNKIAQTALGAYAGHRANKQEDQLETRRQEGMQDWVSQMPTDRNEMMAWALRGQEFGDMGQALGSSVASQALQPPQRNLKSVGDRLYDVDKGAWVDTPEGGSPAAINKVTPGHYTPGSLAQYAETGDYNVLERYEPGKTVEIGGVPHAFDPVSMKWYPAAVEPGQRGGMTSPPESGEPRPVTAQDVATNLATLKEAETAAGKGMRITDDGRQVPIEGSPEQRKEESAAKQRRAMIERRAPGVLRDVQRSLELVDNAGPVAGAVAVPGGESAGMFRKIIAAQSPAFELNQHMESVKSNISIEELQSMRDSSPTGGALGQIPVRQQEFLMQMQGALNPQLQPDVLRENLRFVHNNYLKALLDATYGDAQEIDTAIRDGRITPEQAAELQAERAEAEKKYREALEFDQYGQRGPVTISSDEEYDALPPGTEFIAPDGSKRRKP